MAINMLFAFALDFLVSAIFGRFYIPWLKKKNLEQPLKDEVAQIYENRTDSESEED